MSGHTACEAALKAYATGNGIAPGATYVYSGRRPRRIRNALREVWIERLESENAGAPFHDVAKHRYTLHLLSKPGNAGAQGTGEVQLERGEGWAEIMANQLRGDVEIFRPHLGSQLVCVEAFEETVDEDPDEAGYTSFAVRVDIWRLVTP